MEAIIILVLAVLAFVGGAAFKGQKNKNKEIKEQVVLAKKREKEGEIDATLAFADRVKKAEAAVEAKIDARPITDDAAADLADRVKRKRRRRRRRQHYGADKPTD